MFVTATNTPILFDIVIIIIIVVVVVVVVVDVVIIVVIVVVVVVVIDGGPYMLNKIEKCTQKRDQNSNISFDRHAILREGKTRIIHH